MIFMRIQRYRFFIANVFHKTDNIRFEVIKHSIVKCLSVTCHVKF